MKASETFCNDVKVVDVVDLLKPPCGTFDSISTAVLYESYMHLAVRGGSVIAKASEVCETRVMDFVAKAVSGRDK